jgi:hypothetical protein
MVWIGRRIPGARAKEDRMPLLYARLFSHAAMLAGFSSHWPMFSAVGSW